MSASAEEIPFLLAALETEPGNWNTRRYVANYYLSNGDEKRAIALVTTSPSPPDTEDHSLFAAQVTSRLSVNRAVALLDAFLVDNAASARAHYLKAQFLEQTSQADKAATHRRVALAINPELEMHSDELLMVTDVDQESMHGLAAAYQEVMPEVAAAPAPVAAQVQPRPMAPPSAAVAPPVAVAEADAVPLAEVAPVAEVAQPVEETPVDVAPPGATVEEEAIAAAPMVEEVIAEPAQPVEVAAIKPMGPPMQSMDYAAADAASNPDAILDAIEAEEAEAAAAGGYAESDVAHKVEHQAAVVAALADTSGDVMKKPNIDDLKDTNNKVSSILIAVLAHVGIILLFGLVAMAIPETKPPEIYAAVASADVDSELEKTNIEKPTVQQQAPQAQQVEVLTSSMFSDIAMPTVDVSTISDMTGMSAETGMDFGMSFGMPGGGSGMSNIPPSMAGRCSMGQRMQRLKESGATAAAESAVRKALQFIKKNQNEDGSFGKEYPASVTALAVLAYLGHCETPDSVEFGNSVTRAAQYLLERSVKSDGDYIQSPGLNAQDRTVCYEHPIVAYALAEMYTMTKASGSAARIPRLESGMKKAIRGVIKGQAKNGGWGYSYRENHVDTSVVGWNFQALEAATHTGEKITGLESALDKAIKHLQQIQNEDGGFPYKGGDQSKTTLSPVGTLAYEMWEMGDSKECEKAFEYLDTKVLKGGPNVYGWYYAMQAYFLEGGDKWKAWNSMAMNKILAAQTPEGNFKMPGGHGPKDPVSSALYDTCLCTLMLEVYYRYLPTSQKNFGK